MSLETIISNHSQYSTKECLNNRIGNDGAYYSNQLTQQGNIPTDDLMCLSIGAKSIC